MQYYYANITERGKCFGVCELSGPVDHPALVEIKDIEDKESLVGMIYDAETASWSPAAEQPEGEVPPDGNS